MPRCGYQRHSLLQRHDHVSLLTLTTRRRRSKSRLITLKCMELCILCTNLTSGFIFLSLFFLPSDFPTNLSYLLILCIFYKLPQLWYGTRWGTSELVSKSSQGRVVSSSREQSQRIWLSFQHTKSYWDSVLDFPKRSKHYCQWVSERPLLPGGKRFGLTGVNINKQKPQLQ